MNETPEKLLLSIPDFMAVTGLGRTTVYAIIGDGSLESVTVGRRRLIPTAAARAWVEGLPRN